MRALAFGAVLTLGPAWIPGAMAATVVSSSHVTPQASTGVETSHVLGVQTLHGASITTGAVAGYFMLLNAAADPGNGAVQPAKCIAVAANSTGVMSPDANTQWDFPKGIVLVFSTTGCFVETQSATAYFSWQ
jgi:hypothetical protein